MQALSAKLQELATKRGKDLQDGSAFGPGREGMVFQVAIKSEAAITPSGIGPRPMREICTSGSLSLADSLKVGAAQNAYVSAG